MAPKTTLLCLAFMVILWLVLTENGCNGLGYVACFHAKALGPQETQSRKMLFAMMDKEAKKGESESSVINGGGKSLVGQELRRVPSGPDPLHHNGGIPKRPRSTP